MIKDVDIDKDGKICFEEFNKIMLKESNLKVIEKKVIEKNKVKRKSTK